MTAFVAIDFETANQRRDAPCSLGVVRVEDGVVADQWATLINPEAEFSPMNISIHGIRPGDVQDAPTFPAVAERLVDTVEDAECLVAHNAAFDIGVLRQTLERYGATMSELRFGCTLVFARRWFPSWPTYSLGYVVEALDLYEQCGEGAHHDALWDARACAAVANAGFATAGVQTWEEAGKAVGVRLGVLAAQASRACRGHGGGGRSGSIRPVYPDEADLVSNLPLHGVKVCFTGRLSHLSRSDAAQLVADTGGTFANSVTATTDLLVVGQQDLDRLAGHTESAKMRKAATMAAEGHPIEIISEDDFAELIAR